MAQAGDTKVTPFSGTRIRFLETARDTNGELLRLDDIMQGGQRVPIEHVHPHMEERFETFFGLQKDGKVDPRSGLPNPLQWAIISREYEDEIHLVSPPLWVQKVRFGLLAPIGKLLGYKARYPAYSGAEEPLAERGGERLSKAPRVRRVGIAVGAVVAVVTLSLLRRRVRSGRSSYRRFQLLGKP